MKSLRIGCSLPYIVGLEVAASLPCSCIAGWMDRLLTTRSNGLMLTSSFSRFVAHGGIWEHHSP
uniref:Predicted protein n=1 Tax=Hordeum vulgare subsp. vulgare TaxID=112509 RepID=F2D5U0_HORVV|nr:predicted protein [Hordeum vulgare subsp. vulgare]